MELIKMLAEVLTGYILVWALAVRLHALLTTPRYPAPQRKQRGTHRRS
jgi:hypothetical protein